MGWKNMHRELRWGNLKERKHFKDVGVEGKIILK
jgi:hypothetical protein